MRRARSSSMRTPSGVASPGVAPSLAVQAIEFELRERRFLAGRWRIEHGPFARRRLARMPRAGWTLLVQGVDQNVPRAADLLREFAFIPHARVDDVMVSYASDEGGVGPHFDQYDVFLIQGLGRRRWRVGAACGAVEREPV